MFILSFPDDSDTQKGSDQGSLHFWNSLKMNQLSCADLGKKSKIRHFQLSITCVHGNIFCRNLAQSTQFTSLYDLIIFFGSKSYMHFYKPMNFWVLWGSFFPYRHVFFFNFKNA